MTAPLVRLATVQAYLAIDPTKTTPTLVSVQNRLIRAASTFALGWMGRDQGLAVSQYVERRDGNGLSFMLLRNWPAVKLTSIDLGNGTILTTPSTGSPRTNGYLLDDASGAPQRVDLVGYGFPRGRMNIVFNYNAGYQITAEAQTIPATGPYQLNTDEEWLGDLGVTYASSGVPLVSVAGAPAAGQYRVDANGLYTFNVADAGVGVLTDYDYTPSDIVQAVCELVGERYRWVSHIGETTHNQGGQVSVGFSQKDMNDTIKTLLRPYRSVTPV